MRKTRKSSPIGWGLLAILTGLAGLWGLSNQGSSSPSSDLGLSPATSGSSTTVRPSTSSTGRTTSSSRPSQATGTTAAATSSTTAPIASGAAADLAGALSDLCDQTPPIKLIALGELATPAEVRAAANDRLDAIATHLDALGSLAFPAELEPARAQMRSHLEAARALLGPNAEWPDGPTLEAGSEPFVRASTADNELGRYGVAAGLLGADNCAQPST